MIVQELSSVHTVDLAIEPHICTEVIWPLFSTAASDEVVINVNKSAVKNRTEGFPCTSF